MKDDEADARQVREKWNRCPECDADIRDGREHKNKCSLCGANKEARRTNEQKKETARSALKELFPPVSDADRLPYAIRVPRIEVFVDDDRKLSFGGASRCGCCGFGVDRRPNPDNGTCPKCGWDGKEPVTAKTKEEKTVGPSEVRDHAADLIRDNETADRVRKNEEVIAEWEKISKKREAKTWAREHWPWMNQKLYEMEAEARNLRDENARLAKEITEETAKDREKIAELKEKSAKLSKEIASVLDEETRMKRERNELQEKLDGETIATDSKNYRARCWRTEHLKRAAAEDLDAMVHGLLGNHKLRVERGDYEIPGCPHCRHHTVMVRVDGWATTGYTREGAMARMLGLMLEGAWYPLT